MHYKVNDLVIKSENSAKSHLQASKETQLAIKNIGKVKKALDFGCGKLRYLKNLLEISEELVLIDSEIQLTRKQKIHGEFTSVNDYIKRYSNINAQPFEKCIYNNEFDFILISNVLSAIPHISMRVEILKLSKKMIKDNGIILVVNQYTNSFFSLTKPGSIKYYDGFISKNGFEPSFYGKINRKNGIKLCEIAGLEVNKAIKAGQSYHIYLKKGNLTTF